VTFWSVFRRWENSAKPFSPRHRAELSSIFLVRALMSSSPPAGSTGAAFPQPPSAVGRHADRRELGRV